MSSACYSVLQRHFPPFLKILDVLVAQKIKNILFGCQFAEIQCQCVFRNMFAMCDKGVETRAMCPYVVAPFAIVLCWDRCF